MDEWTYAQLVEPSFYRERLRQHWDTFITREDLAAVAEAGVSHVRIPVGYWYWDVEEGEPFPAVNSDPSDPYSPLHYLQRGLVWCQELGLKALLDLHAGPGSQNGFDNSGRRGDIGWEGLIPVYRSVLLPRWVTENYPSEHRNVARTVHILGLVAATLADWVDQGVVDRAALYGISLLNEPGGWWDKVCSSRLHCTMYTALHCRCGKPAKMNSSLSDTRPSDSIFQRKSLW